jgi:hypothetical protein
MEGSNLTTSLYETRPCGNNVLPSGHNGTALAVKEPDPRDQSDDKRDSSTNRHGNTGPKQGPQRNGRPTEPKPDALWHTPNREAWATVGGRHFPVQSSEFRHWLAGRFYECNGEAASAYKLDELVSTYSAEALFKNPEHRVHLRTAQQSDVIWLDLADAEGRAVRIDKEGWRVVPAREVTPKFFRAPNMRALPDPLREERDASQLRALLNLPNEDTFRLLLTWLSFAIVPDQPYPVIAVSGPAGAAKSSFAELVWTTIDPNEVPLAGMPRGQDLVAYAKNNAVLCFDNLSTISPYLADDLCRLATGGGLGGRRSTPTMPRLPSTRGGPSCSRASTMWRRAGTWRTERSWST